jgi:hypothetical protein
MANEFIARKGFISLTNAQITGSLSVTGDVSASAFSGSFIGDGSQLSGIEGFPFTGSAGITGSLTVVGPVNATTFTGDGSQLTGIEGFPYTGSAGITGSLIVNGNVEATSFTGSLQGTSTSSSYVQLVDVDGFTAYSSSVNTAIGSVLDATTPFTATVNTTNTPFTLTSQSIVVADSTDGNLTINLPDLDTIVGTPNQKPIVVYKNDYSQNVIYVQPSGSQLINGASQDLIVSIQLAVIYNPTSAGWVTEGTSAQSLAELELFFVPRTETGSLSVATSSYVEYSNVANKPALVSGSGQISFSGITGKPTLVSGSSQISFTDITNKPTGIVSSSVQVKGYNVFATTGSNQFDGSQAVTGSLTVTGQVVAQTLNVQQVTSSIVYSSGSNIFGNSLDNTQQFTGSVSVTGSMAVNSSITVTGDGSNDIFKAVRSGVTRVVIKNGVNTLGINTDTINNPLTVNGGADFSGNVGIGTDSPNDLMEIKSTSANQANYRLYNTFNDGANSFGISWFRNYDSATNSQGAFINYVRTGGFTGDLSFGTGGVGEVTEQMRITSDGNLGLGVTPSAWSVIQAMQVLNTSWGASPNNLILYQSSNIFYDGAFKYITTGTASQYRMNDSGIFSWLQAPSGTAGGTITFTQAMTLDASGRLGIGTPTPSQRLHVANAAGSVVAFLQSTATNGEASVALEGRNSSGTTRNAIFKYDNADIFRIGTSSPIDFRFETNDIERMRISSGGLLILNSTTAGGGTKTTFNVIENGGVVIDSSEGSTPRYIEFATAGTPKMFIAAGGNVGVGNALPSGRFHVTSTGITASSPSLGWPVYNAEQDANARLIYVDTEGNGNVSTAGSGATVVVQLGQYFDSRVVITPPAGGSAVPSDQGTGRGKDLMLKAGTSDNSIGLKGGRLYLNGGMGFGGSFNTNGGDILMQSLTGSGNVGIGTSSANFLLTLSLPSGVNGEIIRMNRSAGAYGWSLGIDSSTSNFNFYNNGSTSVANINNSTGAYTATSDQRLKENILDSNNALEKVLQIKVRKYDWKDTEIKEDFGFIAQELFGVLPQYVHQGDENTNWGVAKAELVPVLVKAIQEQQSQIESLKAEIQTLKQ